MPVAKTYSNWEIKSKPYLENNRYYIDIMSGTRTRTVRWYNDLEYARMYHEEIPTAARPVKNLLGFEKGYITLIYGDVDIYQDYLKSNPACYFNRVFGWFVHSENEVPRDLPEGLKTKVLDWEDVGDDRTERLIPEEEVLKVVHDVIFGESPSQYQGEIGDRIERILTVVKCNQISGAYGLSSMYYLEDAYRNSYFWLTNSCIMKEKKSYKISGTVKAFRVFKGVNQTVLTRCHCVEIEKESKVII